MFHSEQSPSNVWGCDLFVPRRKGQSTCNPLELHPAKSHLPRKYTSEPWTRGFQYRHRRGSFQPQESRSSTEAVCTVEPSTNQIKPKRMDAFREYLSATNPAINAPKKAPISSIPVIRLLHRQDELRVPTVCHATRLTHPLLKLAAVETESLTSGNWSKKRGMT